MIKILDTPLHVLGKTVVCGISGIHRQRKGARGLKPPNLRVLNRIHYFTIENFLVD